MRGKDFLSRVLFALIRITPAYAGKREGPKNAQSKVGDHPRVCGEKIVLVIVFCSLMGSPPRMRGKVMRKEILRIIHGITPAYAGKREGPKNAQSKVGDHPRVCGEKCIPLTRGHGRQGSPPRMRGKVQLGEIDLQDIWITPAYAGKSGPCPDRVPPAGDHPRVCGEKSQSTSASPRALGSPPRMRGKGVKQSNSRIRMGITPAYAGKSCIYRSTTSISWDHPRVCGEKSFKTSTSCWSKGSPPRMRGKGIQPCNQWVRVGITPAYAGKRYEEMLQQAGR